LSSEFYDIRKGRIFQGISHIQDAKGIKTESKQLYRLFSRDLPIFACSFLSGAFIIDAK
jgi:hypothetical protein